MNEIPNNLIAIGQFSKLTKLSLKALRLYHNKGLLVPTYVDQFTSYRYYAKEQVRQAKYIQILREMEMPLNMIEQFLELFDQQPTDAAAVLQAYLKLFDARVSQVHQTAQHVTRLLQDEPIQYEFSEQEESLMDTTQEVSALDTRPIERERLFGVLKKVTSAIEPVLSKDEYRLIGTAASALHGAETPAMGIDILVRNREGVEAFHLAMSPFRTDAPPMYVPEEQIYWASYVVDEVSVEVAANELQWESDGVESGGEGPWKYFEHLPCGEHSIPTVNLELRLITELSRDRPDRYEPLLHHMCEGNFDEALLRRGMTNRRMPQIGQDAVIAQLNNKETQNV